MDISTFCTWAMVLSGCIPILLGFMWGVISITSRTDVIDLYPDNRPIKADSVQNYTYTYTSSVPPKQDSKTATEPEIPEVLPDQYSCGTCGNINPVKPIRCDLIDGQSFLVCKCENCKSENVVKA